MRLDADSLEHLLHRWRPGVERRRIPDQEVHAFEALGMAGGGEQLFGLRERGRGIGLVAEPLR